MSAASPERGDVFFARFTETIASGRIPIKERPAVVVARKQFGETTIVIPITSSEESLRYRRRQPTCIMVDAGTGGLKKESAILVHSIREVDRKFLANEDYWGRMPDPVMAQIDEILRDLLGLQ